MKLAVLGLLVVAGTAHADAPGEVPCVVARPAGDAVMARRWAVGLSVGGMSIAPKGGGDETHFDIGQLSVRYRATRHLELELAVGGGRQQLDSGDQGDLAISTGTLAARYRFRPDAAWNWYLMAGIGGTAVTRHDATDDERDDASRPHAMLGVGIERRFRAFALEAELRGLAVGKRDDDAMERTTTAMPAQEQSGGMFTVGASYYF